MKLSAERLSEAGPRRTRGPLSRIGPHLEEGPNTRERDILSEVSEALTVFRERWRGQVGKLSEREAENAFLADLEETGWLVECEGQFLDEYDRRGHRQPVMCSVAYKVLLDREEARVRWLSFTVIAPSSWVGDDVLVTATLAPGEFRR